MSDDKRIRIFDTTLRDGEQSPGCSMNLEEKLTLARQLERLGVDVIEAGFPIASDGDFEAVRAVAAELREPIVAGLARTAHDDIERAGRALEPARHSRIHTFIATSDIHLEHKLRMGREQVLEEVDRAVRQARGFTDDVEFSAEDATRTDWDYLVQVFRGRRGGGRDDAERAGHGGLHDAGRVRTSSSQYLKSHIPGSENLIFSLHCHNDLGLAVANSLAAVQAGARQVECTVNGIGERAGNTALEEVVMALKTRPDAFEGLDTGVRTAEIYPTSRLLSSIIGIPVQPNKAIVGDNAFAHEAGIHQHGVLANALTYEIMTPESIGRTSNELVLGKHSGRHAFRDRLADARARAVKATSSRMLSSASRTSRTARRRSTTRTCDSIVAQADGEPRHRPLRARQSRDPERHASPSPNATVEMEVDGEPAKATAQGDGPVDAVFKAIVALTARRRASSSSTR